MVSRLFGFLAFLFFGTATALEATTVSFDSDSVAWQAAATTWPGAGPIVDVSGLIAATAFTFTVSVVEADQPDVDKQFLGQTVCYGGSFLPLCSSTFFRGPIDFTEASTQHFFILFSIPLLGALFPSGPTIFALLEDATLNVLDGASQVSGQIPGLRQSIGLPPIPTSFGFLSDQPFSVLDIRQTMLPEGTTPFFVPQQVVAAVPEPATLTLLGLGFGLTALLRVSSNRRRHRAG